jgi:phosphate transport system permease protein
MTGTDLGAPPVPDAGESGRRSLRVQSANGRKRRRRGVAMEWLIRATLLAGLVPVALILLVVIQRGLPAMSWEFLTETTPFSVMEQGGGFYQGLVGTALMVSIATLISVPLGIFTALFLVEMSDSRLAKPVRFFSDVMTGVPSVFVGLFVYAFLVRRFGYGTLWGGLALAILMLPIVVRSCEEVLKLVPNDLRFAAYGLGARRWQTGTKVVLPAASSGLVTGSMLAIARAAGETAPLLMTAAGSLYVVTSLTGQPQSALSLLIWDSSKSAFVAAQQRAWAGALELMLIVLVFTVIARVVSRRSSATVML